MIIDVNRFTSDNDTTLCLVAVDGVFECFGLEDEYRAHKIPGATRIPAGSYNVALRTVGAFHNRYKGRFPDFHEGMLHVVDVPLFEHILIHMGNDHDDTAGCLLLGKNAVTLGSLKIPASRPAYEDFYQKVIPAAKAGDLRIRYVDNDR